MPLQSWAVSKPAQCVGCPLYHAVDADGRATGPVWGTGPKDAQVVLLGEAPGTEEYKRKQPFVGQAGRLLSILATEAGLSRDLCYITNVVKCMPPNPRNPRSFRTPTKAEVAFCSNAWLKDELREVNPNITVPLGDTAWKAIDPNAMGKSLDGSRGKGTKKPPWRGSVIEVPDFWQKGDDP